MPVKLLPPSAGPDARRLLFTRSLRGFGDGLASLVLASYLTRLGLSPFEIGAIVTGTLLGSAALTLASGLVGHRLRRRAVLLAREDSVMVYPTQRNFPPAALAGPNNALLVTLKQMIERRQALVRPGDPPFRPHVRFLVLPENLRSFHLAFPALEALPVPKSRQNLDPEDDVPTIVAGP